MLRTAAALHLVIDDMQGLSISCDSQINEALAWILAWIVTITQGIFG